MSEEISPCGNCRHWDPDNDVFFKDDYDYNRYRHPATVELGICQLHAQASFDWNKNRPPEGGAGVIDGSDYFAALITHKAFGCINGQTS